MSRPVCRVPRKAQRLAGVTETSPHRLHRAGAVPCGESSLRVPDDATPLRSRFSAVERGGLFSLNASKLKAEK